MSELDHEIRPGDLVRIVRCSVIWLMPIVPHPRAAAVRVECGDAALVVTVGTDDCVVLLLTLRSELGWLGRPRPDSLTAWVERIEP